MYNTIQEVINSDIGTQVKVRCMVVSKQRLPRKGSGDYIKLMLQDNTGKIEMPVWDNVQMCDEVINLGDKLIITGKRGEYDRTPQIQKEQVDACEGETQISDFIPAYNIPGYLFGGFAKFVAKIKDQRYRNILKNTLGITVSEYIDGNIERDFPKLVIEDKDKWDKFIQAPSAEKHHGNKLGGLFLHTFGVCMAVDNMIYNYVDMPFFLRAEKTQLDPDRLRFLAIMHDFDKTEEYEWELEIKYKENKQVGHEVSFIETMTTSNIECGKVFSKKELEDMYFIVLTHHGKWGKYQPGKKDKELLESKLLHCADMIDSQIVGEIESSH